MPAFLTPRCLTCPTSRGHLRRALLALTLGGLAGGVAQAAPWTTVGSAGVVDDADLGLHDFVAGEARIKASAAAGQNLMLRYNVTALESFTGFNSVAWRVRFRDNGAGSQVRLTLRQYNLAGGTNTLATFDSNAYLPSNDYQVQVKCIGVDWDFQNGPFFIEADLIKSGASGQPAVGVILLNNESCEG